MHPAITVTLIVCGTMVLLSVLNHLNDWAARRHDLKHGVKTWRLK